MNQAALLRNKMKSKLQDKLEMVRDAIISGDEGRLPQLFLELEQYQNEFERYCDNNNH